MQAQGVNWAQVVTMLLVAVLLVGSFMWMAPNDQEIEVPEAEISNAQMEALAIAVADRIVVEVPEVQLEESELTLRLCELTDGCEYYEVYTVEAQPVRDVVELLEDDFVEALAELVEVDEDYLEVGVVQWKDSQVRAYSEEDKDDENYDVKVFYRVEYRDTDDEDYDYVYILVSSVLDEGEYDSLELSEVSRVFEFE